MTTQPRRSSAKPRQKTKKNTEPQLILGRTDWRPGSWPDLFLKQRPRNSPLGFLRQNFDPKRTK